MVSFFNSSFGGLLALFMLILAMGARADEVALPTNLDDVALKKVGEGVYVLHGLQQMPNEHNKGMISNTGVLLTSRGVVIVDSGGNYEIGRLIVEKVGELSDEPIIAVFNSHVHGDHWLGNSALREAYPKVKILAHEKAIQRLEKGEAERWRDIIQRMVGDTRGIPDLVLPTVALHGGETLTFGDTNLKIHHTGHAHTDSDIMVEAPGQKIIFAGDVVEYGRVVSSDVPEDFDIKGQIDAIKHILSLPAEIYVPGHGPTGGREIPEVALRFLQILHTSVKKHYDAGLADFEMKEKVVVELKEFSNWFNFDQIGKMISIVYLQVEEADFQ